MSGRVRSCTVFLILAVVLALVPALARAGSEVQTFSAKSTDGVEFSLDPYLGKVPILLDFGSIYCSSCIKSIPALVVLQNEYSDRLKVVGVNLDTYGLERVRRFYAAFKGSLNFPILIDSNLKISKAFSVATLPTYVLIDRSGKVASTIIGYDQETKLKMERLVKKLVEGGEIGADEEVVTQNVLLLSPDTFTKTLQEEISVIGTTGGIEGPIKVKLNGGSERIATIKGGMFFARTPLALGSNFIEVQYPKGSGFSTSAVVIFRDPRMGDGLGINFPEYQFHLPEKESRCTECHNMNPDNAGEGLASKDYCAKCHGNQVNVKFVHGPITVGGCVACHDFTSKPHKYDVGAEGADLCFSCHADVQAKFDHPYVHGPVAMGICIACHSPHGSDFKYQLRHQQSSLCLGCHDDSRAKMSKFKPHRPVMEDKCTSCHDPHASENPKAFLKKPGAELCDMCHKDKMATHTHPTDGPPPGVAPGMVMDAAGNMNCQTCHDPHSSDEARLFTVQGGCDGCHKI